MADAVFGPDFLNTHPVLNGRPAELIPDFDALLRWLRAAKLIRSRDVARLRRRWAESAWARQTAEGMREQADGIPSWHPRRPGVQEFMSSGRSSSTSTVLDHHGCRVSLYSADAGRDRA